MDNALNYISIDYSEFNKTNKNNPILFEDFIIEPDYKFQKKFDIIGSTIEYPEPTYRYSPLTDVDKTPSPLILVNNILCYSIQSNYFWNSEIDFNNRTLEEKKKYSLKNINIFQGENFLIELSNEEHSSASNSTEQIHEYLLTCVYTCFLFFEMSANVSEQCPESA